MNVIVFCKEKFNEFMTHNTVIFLKYSRDIIKPVLRLNYYFLIIEVFNKW